MSLPLTCTHPNFIGFCKALRTNTKYKFNERAGQWSVKTTQHADIVLLAFDLYCLADAGLCYQRSGDTVIVYDYDVRTNRAWTRIWVGTIPPGLIDGTLTVGLRIQQPRR